MIQIPYYETSYFAFSNFSAHSIRVDGILYPTAEHAYHAQKFTDQAIIDELRAAGSPLEAYEIAHRYKSQRKENWDDIKVSVLYELVREKVRQHKEVRDTLLASGDEDIVEVNPNDDFWGNGPDGNGQNQTGKILMRIREELKASA